MQDRYSTYYDQMSRVNRSSPEARKVYDFLSRMYDGLAEPFERKYREAAVGLLDVQPGDAVLEIGCGTGNALLSLARRVGEEGRVYGLDLSPAMLRVAKKKLTKKKLLHRVVLEEGNALYMPFLEDSFDRVFMGFTLELFDTPEIPLLLEKCRQVMHKEAKIAVVSLSRTPFNAMVRMYEWGHRNFPRLLDCRPIYLRELMLHSGLRVEHAESHKLWGLPVEIVLAKKE